jgi:hypothetical protein
VFGDKWQSVTGKVLEVHKQAPGHSHALEQTYYNKYVIEATVPDGTACRGELDGVLDMRTIRLDVGDDVALLYNPRKHALKWDKDDRDLKTRRGIADLDDPQLDAFRDSSGKVDRDKLLQSVLHPPAIDDVDVAPPT